MTRREAYLRLQEMPDYSNMHKVLRKGCWDTINEEDKDWNDVNYVEGDDLALSDVNTKSKGFGILIDAPNFMMPHLQDDISFLTDTLLIKYNSSIIQSVFY